MSEQETAFSQTSLPQERAESQGTVLPVKERLFALIITQLSFGWTVLAAWHTSFACPKEVSRKRHPVMPALRASLRCSPVAGRQKTR
jgi:hypothetical protein